jgi:hypothetical protein
VSAVNVIFVAWRVPLPAVCKFAAVAFTERLPPTIPASMVTGPDATARVSVTETSPVVELALMNAAVVLEIVAPPKPVLRESVPEPSVVPTD